MDTTATPRPRLTQFSHGGGCGCKISPGVLRDLIAKSSPGLLPNDLLVGIVTADDAAVYRINDRQAIVATTDFFMPIVDDPFDFGAIAATNALSDIYAMGATPLFALALVAMPVDRLPLAMIREILAGGESVCARAGIPVAGGHTIDSVEPIYGLVAIGIVDPARIKRNVGAKPGDVLVLGKPLGVGVLAAALRKQQLGDEDYASMLAQATQLNTPGVAFGSLDSVHALTDVTGFGLLGHLLEVCRGSDVGARLDFERVPLLPGAMGLARAGYAHEVKLQSADNAVAQALLTDPQTSGGLLLACEPTAIAEALAVFRNEGFGHAAAIGEITAGPPRVIVD
jgi:selenide,water dikinase